MVRNDRHCRTNENQRYLYKHRIITTQMFKNIMNSEDTVMVVAVRVSTCCSFHFEGIDCQSSPQKVPFL